LTTEDTESTEEEEEGGGVIRSWARYDFFDRITEFTK
jgi:hypothetical protein